MQTKLTIRLEKDLVDQAKVYANEQGKSVSKMVADYFLLLKESSPIPPATLLPVAQSLKGAFRDAEIDEADYGKYLEDKHL